VEQVQRLGRPFRASPVLIPDSVTPATTMLHHFTIENAGHDVFRTQLPARNSFRKLRSPRGFNGLWAVVTGNKKGDKKAAKLGRKRENRRIYLKTVANSRLQNGKRI
jgi:hypothetical protein